MALLLGVLRPLQFLNDHVLRVGRAIAVVAIALMVAAILYQVVMRYVFSDAPNWTEEFARFMMLWMTGLIAASAYRVGGFVAIDMVESVLPKRVAAILSLFLLIVSLGVLLMGIKLGWGHVNGGWLFKSASLKIPLDWFGGKAFKMPLAYMYMSLFVGLILLTLVNIELILRSLVTLGGRGNDLRALREEDLAGAS